MKATVNTARNEKYKVTNKKEEIIALLTSEFSQSMHFANISV